eukprot:13752598-Alexandrium_andersonii.AAC.1
MAQAPQEFIQFGNKVQDAFAFVRNGCVCGLSALLGNCVLGCWRGMPARGRARVEVVLLQAHAGLLACAGELWLAVWGLSTAKKSRIL